MKQRIFFLFFSLLAVISVLNVQNKTVSAPTTSVPSQEVVTEAVIAQIETPTEAVTETPKSNQGCWTITGYCGCEYCCGIWALNRPVDENGNEIVCGASGRELISGYSCATNSLPLGTIIEIEGLGTWRVDDRGTVGIDLYYSSHEEASNVGRQYRQIYIVGGDTY